MVFIDNNGRVLERKPLSTALVSTLNGLWFAAIQFFMTLVSPFMRENGTASSDNARRGGWSGGSRGGGSGGGGGGSGSGGNEGMRPNRRIGRIQNSMDCNIPGGGCCGR